jgi:hypothetical protein
MAGLGPHSNLSEYCSATDLTRYAGESSSKVASCILLGHLAPTVLSNFANVRLTIKIVDSPASLVRFNKYEVDR